MDIDRLIKDILTGDVEITNIVKSYDEKGMILTVTVYSATLNTDYDFPIRISDIVRQRLTWFIQDAVKQPDASS